MRKKQWGILLMVLCWIGAAPAASVLWCSDTSVGGSDQGWIDLLAAKGYTVDRLESAGEMTQAKADLANTYDLVIVSRATNSGAYAGDLMEVGIWNGITAPLICQNGWLWRNNRWKWLDSDSTFNTNTNIAPALAPGDLLYDSLFAGALTAADGTFDYSNTAGDTVALAETASAGNGVLIGHRDYEPQPWVYAAYWDTGLEFYNGSGQFAGGPRLALGARESIDSLTEDGVIIFLNAVYFMSGATFDREPFVRAGNNRIANAHEPMTVDASIFDPEDAAVITWSQLSGPAAALFDDNTVEDPAVTFPAAGVYELEVMVTDGTSTVSDGMTVTVRDNADNAMIAHWNFEDLPDPNTLIDVTGNGFNGVFYAADGGDPNVAAGNLFGGSLAADLREGDGYWEVPDSYDNTEPNFNDLATGMTAAAWVKISDNSVIAPMIVGNGLDGWRLGVNTGTFNLVCHDIGLDIFAPGDAYDGQWHHVAGVYDGVAAQAHLYVDGLPAVTRSVTPGSLFSKGQDYPLIQIANRGDAHRPWRGYLDDVRVYNYPLTAGEIAALALAGNLPVKVTAGADQTVFYKGAPIQLEGQLLSDDGFPAYASLEWSVISVPDGVDPGQVVISDITVETPTAAFPNREGTYVLRLTADDGEYTVIDNVTIDLLIPSCADVLADGLGLATDISGPEGVADCRVNLYDFAAFASDWLRCNDPADEDCEWAYQQ